MITQRNIKERKINDNTKKYKRKKNIFWVRQIYKKREELGVFWTLLQELKQDREYFFRYLRMTPERFNHLHELVRNKITKSDTKFRKSIPSEERVAITLRFLATGES